MKEFKSRIKVEAMKWDPEYPILIDDMKKSNGWRPSSSFHDRFIEEPETPSYYVYGENGEKVFLTNKCVLVKHTIPSFGLDEGKTWFETQDIDNFNSEYKEIK
jgi:hypothetical protein